MASSTSVSQATVSIPHAVGAIGLALAGLVVLAITPLGGLVASSTGLMVVRVLFLVWLGLSLAADIRKWETYSRSRRQFALGVWFFLSTSAVSSFIVG
ncbi:MAG: hypothetical protein AAF791_00450 [Bacteroidota bacterium]